MKNTLLIFSFLACITIGVNAQDKTFLIGSKLGPTLDWASPGSTVVENKGIGLGFNIGAVAEYYFTPNLALSSGLDFCLMQTHYQFTGPRVVDGFLEEALVSLDRRVRGSFLELPLKAKVKMGVTDLWQAYVEAGLGLAVNLRDYGRDEFDFFGVSYADQSYLDYSNQYRLLQASLLFGLGVEYEVNLNLSLFAQLSLKHSLSNSFIREIEKQTGSNVKANFVGIEIGLLTSL